MKSTMTTNTSRNERRFAIFTLVKHLRSTQEAAMALGYHPRTVSTLLQNEKTVNLGDKNRYGRARKLAGEAQCRSINVFRACIAAKGRSTDY